MGRLREKLGGVEVTSNGIYLENCKYVKFGFFGNLEVFSRQAASTYIANLDDCKKSLNYMVLRKITVKSHGVKICSRSVAWTCTGSTGLAHGTSPPTGCARPIVPRARRKTRNGSQTARRHRRQQCTHS